MKKLSDIPQYDIILVDTMNLAAIQYYSKLNLLYKGHLTGMLYGVLLSLNSLRNLYSSARIMILWEGYQSLRKARCEEYKAKRKTIDSDFKKSLMDVKNAFTLLPIEEVVHVGLEADDLAGYFCSLYKSKRILLVSNDRDWWQFSEAGRVDIYIRGAVLTYNDLMLKLGYPPEKIGMYKILKGDDSDNVSGVPRFPTKLALRMMQKCSTYKDFLTYRFRGPEVKWRKVLRFYWESIVERNAMLILYHPEWIVKKHIIRTKRQSQPDRLLVLLKSRGMKSLVKRMPLS